MNEHGSKLRRQAKVHALNWIVVVVVGRGGGCCCCGIIPLALVVAVVTVAEYRGAETPLCRLIVSAESKRGLSSALHLAELDSRNDRQPASPPPSGRK